ITRHEAKDVSSTEGMERSRITSPFYNQWLRSAGDDYAEASMAIAQRDFEKLAAIAELSCLKMHSLMLTSRPTLSYWTPASVACMDRVRELRSQGEAVFFTVDAGPQIKAVCLPESRAAVAKALADVP
ncbi:MAG TPA: diphosphomevalonate decarboxylase, partial [Gammaproteobacteria bacterium]|nr:diphosphomevalonate decarboxylase [Gammaproteobacteria bacterium]